MPKMNNGQRCIHESYECRHTQTQRGERERDAHIYKSQTSLLSHAEKSPGLAPHDSGGENEKITWAIPKSFQSKDNPACSTLQQFNTVFTSDVVIVLSFSLYPVILNDRLKERITWEKCLSPACLCLFMFVWMYVRVVMCTSYACTCLCAQHSMCTPQHTVH